MPFPRGAGTADNRYHGASDWPAAPTGPDRAAEEQFGRPTEGLVDRSDRRAKGYRLPSRSFLQH